MNYKFDFERIWEDKRKIRQRLAAAPIAEKLRMLDAMRERALALRNAKSTQRSVAREEPPVTTPQKKRDNDPVRLARRVTEKCKKKDKGGCSSHDLDI